jgi:hypothetical protein
MPGPYGRQVQAERRAQVMTLRLAGLPFNQIGAQLDPPVSAQRAHQLYLDALARVVKEPAEDVLKADLERLDLLWRAMLTRAAAGSARHAEVALRVLERRARMLGLDAPTRTVAKVSFTDDEEAQLDREIEALLAAAAAVPDDHLDHDD